MTTRLTSKRRRSPHCSVTPCRPWDSSDSQVKGAPIREAMLKCYDGQIDEMNPTPDFKRDQRAALIETLDTFVRLLHEK